MEYLFAGVLGFLGVLFTGAVTLVGFLMKWSFDSHSLRLQKDAEDRLRMETAIRAVALMSTPSGADSPPNQQAGALFALGSLGQLEFALGLLRQMWPSARVDSASAVWLINQAFMSKSENSQEEAADILLQNASLLSTSGKAMVWPRCLSYEWQLDIYVLAREQIFHALLDLLLSRPRDEWSQVIVNAIFVQLYVVMTTETEPRIRIGAVFAVDVLLRLLMQGIQIALNAPSG